ncbi:unnamed protein product [Spirodela intermedia]|uniref:Uncharacterized protein n=1 Tax=Spirodela intermedia TaxID=51605 RepID=A0A7I8KGN2_SPIIN|nr:unnamed protein product [Spirodela intermedia]
MTLLTNLIPHPDDKFPNDVCAASLDCVLFSCSTSSTYNLWGHQPDCTLQDKSIVGCISADDHGNRLFLSDTNHHRIIVTDGDGKILDCIGCSPGFEDGDFDSSKMLRPAGSLYHDGEDCLYFLDTENCAVRRADLGKRVLETLYPAHDKKVSGVWSWILDKLGVGRKFNIEATESDKNLLSCPWHLMKSGEDDLLVFSRSFETLWVMSMTSGEIKEVHKGFSNIMETHGKIIMERASLLKEIITDAENPSLDLCSSSQKIPYPGLMSSIANLQHDIISCDPVGQRVCKYQMGSRDVTNIQFTNFGVLGLPYWMPCPLENVAFSGNPHGEQSSDHLQCFNVLPGRCDIRVKVRVPEGTALAAPLLESCIWRQARGAAAEISAPELAAASVGAAQKWFDELDNLAFSPAPDGSTMQSQETGAMKNAVDSNSVHIDCAVNTSPGTSEVSQNPGYAVIIFSELTSDRFVWTTQVVISAVLYLKLEEAGDSLGNKVRESARRLLALEEKSEHEACVDLLLESREDVREIVFMKPLRLRLRLDCGDYLPATTSKELLPTDCSLEVNVSLV